MEAKLWAAAAALEEHAALARHLATGSGRALGDDAVHGYRRLADRSAGTARALISQLEHREPGPPPTAGNTSGGTAEGAATAP